MKYLILLLLCFNTFASQTIRLPESEIDKALLIEPGVGRILCKDRPLELCIKKPKKQSWHWLKKVDVMMDGDEIHSKSEIETCLDQTDCDQILLAKSCIDEDESPIKNYDLLEVYCSKLIGYEQIPSGSKKLVVDSAKKAAYLQSILDAKDDETDKKNKLKAIKNKIKNNTALTDAEVKKFRMHVLRSL